MFGSRAYSLVALLFLFPILCIADSSIKRDEVFRHPYWLRLLHYTPSYIPFRGSHSRIDSPSFFLHPDGKVDPRAEYVRTVQLFFTEEPSKQICTFPLRYEWLRKHLGLSSKYPAVEALCPVIDRRLNEYKNAKVHLIFPESFINNPASMFGHSLLLIQKHKQSTILSETVSFAADTKDEKGLTFAMNGLFGGYRGRFFYARYDKRVEQYGDIDNRDIWEFDLELSHLELRTLLLHLLELESASFDYYFLDENCSSHLNSIFEVVWPQSELHIALPPWEAPIQTVRKLVDGRQASVSFRPSRVSILRNYETLLSQKEQQKVIELASAGLGKRNIDIQNANKRAQMLLDASHELSLLHKAPQDIRNSLLSARSKTMTTIQAGTSSPVIPPTLGHKTNLFSFGIANTHSKVIKKLRYRPMYHSFEDPQRGFSNESSLSFLDTTISKKIDSRTIRLERLELVSIRSSPLWGKLLKPLSWHAQLDSDRYLFDTNERKLVTRGMLGGGINYLWNSFQLTAFAEAGAYASDQFDRPILLGAGGSTEISHNFSLDFRASLKMQILLWSNDFSPSRRETLNVSYSPSNNHDISLGIGERKDLGSSYLESKLEYKIYF